MTSLLETQPPSVCLYHPHAERGAAYAAPEVRFTLFTHTFSPYLLAARQCDQRHHGKIKRGPRT